MHINKFQARALIIFSLSVALVSSSQAFAQITASPTSTPDTNSFFNTAFWQNVVVAIISAILAFVTGYTLAGVSRKQSSGKKLSYSLLIENGLVEIDKDIRKKVKVFYSSEEIENLYSIKFDLENTGNAVIKSQEIRFEFPSKARILDFFFEPEPEQEMKVEKIESGLRTFERKFKIGQIERGQKLTVRFTATSTEEIREVNLHPYNEGGDIEFISRAVSKAINDKDQMVTFLFFYILYFLLPPIFDSLPMVNSTIASIIALITRISILLNLMKLIIPFSRIIVDVIFIFVSRDRGINIYGNVSNVILGEEEGIGTKFENLSKNR